MFLPISLLLLGIANHVVAITTNTCSSGSLQNSPVMNNVLDSYFAMYLAKFEKVYCDDEEYKLRRTIFEEYVNKLTEMIEKDPRIKYGVNQFSDMTYEEVKTNSLGLKMDMNDTMNAVEFVSTGTAPDRLDYRENGWVSAVKNQGRCGSCYVFSAIGAIEGQYAKNHGQAISLSEQQMLDCDTYSHGRGCDGGIPVDVMNSAAQLPGIVTEQAYPYVGRVSECRGTNQVVARVTSGTTLNIYDEEALKNALAQYGPLSIGIYMSMFLMQQYHGGVAEPNDCNQSRDHAVLLVGYGTDAATKRPFWLIKNSHGGTYGEQGYLRLIRGRNACDILSMISTATVA